MVRITPQIQYVTRESDRNFWNGSKRSNTIIKHFKTYRELKKGIKAVLEESIEGFAYVYRSRRGEWGEWYEHWKLVNGKPTIIEKGWS